MTENSSTKAVAPIDVVTSSTTGASTAATSSTAFSMKHATLLALVLQQVGLVLMIRYSRTTQSYLSSTAVLAAECLKFVLNMSIETVLVSRDAQSSVSASWRQLASPEAWSLLVPALLYVVQNNLLFVALSNLSVPVYQVTNQGKLLTTALCSRVLLSKEITNYQYLSLVMLGLGVAMVQMSGGSSATDTAHQQQQQPLLGFLAVVVSCFTSGFAGVYFEMILKNKKAKSTPTTTPTLSVYVRNAQLAFWSILLGAVPVFTKDCAAVWEHGFFQGYTAVVWGVIFCQAMTGLIVGLVMKYADTILKGFATSVAVVVATIVSFFVFSDSAQLVDGFFVVGASLVMVAVRMYTDDPPKERSVRGGRNDVVVGILFLVCLCVVIGSKSSGDPTDAIPVLLAEAGIETGKAD